MAQSPGYRTVTFCILGGVMLCSTRQLECVARQWKAVSGSERGCLQLSCVCELDECVNGNMRLVNSIDNDPDSGRVEYCFHGDWSPFCGMDDEEATVACKQLGYTDYSCEHLLYTY